MSISQQGCKASENLQTVFELIIHACTSTDALIS